MKYSNELKVGSTIVVATIIFILGVRYFEDLPLFRGTHNLETELENASGLIAGNPVRVRGVSVGSVDEVFINPETGGVRVLFHVDSSLPVPEGTETTVSGVDALGVVRMDLELGPPGNPLIPDGGFVPSKQGGDLMGALAERAPELLDEVDAVMAQLGSVLGESEEMLASPQSDLRLTLMSARRSMDALDGLLRSQRDRLASVLANVDGTTGQLNTFLETNSDSLSAAVTALNGTLRRLDASLAQLDGTTRGLDELLGKINRGEGTLGLLVNDDSMYHRTDSLLTAVHTLLLDFQENPGRYLKEMRLVDLF